jgi:hypothetical protein
MMHAEMTHAEAWRKNRLKQLRERAIAFEINELDFTVECTLDLIWAALAPTAPPFIYNFIINL